MRSSNHTAREAYQLAVRGLHDVEIEEIGQEFTLAEIIEVDKYHRSGAELGKLALQPVPKSITDTHNEGANLLSNNTMTYDDEGEDLLVDDDVIQDIMLERQRTNMPELTVLFRVRRSVVAFILSNWNLIEESNQSKKAG